jgi:hypothetical protein
VRYASKVTANYTSQHMYTVRYASKVTANYMSQHMYTVRYASKVTGLAVYLLNHNKWILPNHN